MTRVEAYMPDFVLFYFLEDCGSSLSRFFLSRISEGDVSGVYTVSRPHDGPPIAPCVIRTMHCS